MKQTLSSETMVSIDFRCNVGICVHEKFGRVDEKLQFCSPKRNNAGGIDLRKLIAGKNQGLSFSEDFLGEDK